MIFNRESLANEMKLSVSTIDRSRKRGILPFHKIGDRIFFTEADLNAFIEACTVTATTASSINKGEQKTVVITRGAK